MRTMVYKVKRTHNHRQSIWKPWLTFTTMFTLVQAHSTIGIIVYNGFYSGHSTLNHRNTSHTTWKPGFMMSKAHLTIDRLHGIHGLKLNHTCESWFIMVFTLINSTLNHRETTWESIFIT